MLESEFTEEHEDDFKVFLDSIGDSVVCVADEEVVKIHVHTNEPGLALQRALQHGQLSGIKIENMHEQFAEFIDAGDDKKADEPRKEVGFITVSVGEGMSKIFTELGVDYIIEGGQTMNPSTDDIITAIEKVNADSVFIYPNNKNIILSANQAKELTKDKNVIVIPTKTIPQGIAALISYMENDNIDTNIAHMESVIKEVKSGQVTYAVRDTQINGKEIKQGDIMGICDKGIDAVGTDVSETTLELLNKLVDEDSGIISLYYGLDVNDEDADKLYSEVKAAYPDVDIDMLFGGQPIYYYILSVE
jgi:DAK2 domain fusion protein YloV